MKVNSMGFFKTNKNKIELTAPIQGKTISLQQVPDQTFSNEILGKGVAILPTQNTVVAPCNGTVDLMMDTAHAVNLVTENGVELMIHVGVDTVSLQGKYFTAHVQSGDIVEKGDPLISFYKEEIQKAGYSTVIPIVVYQNEKWKRVVPVLDKQVNQGDTILILQQ